MSIIENITNNYSNSALTIETILSVILMVFVLSSYCFFVYRYVSHRAFYNKSFNISIAVLPFFVATLILCLRTDAYITLGAIGALAIIRYRTAIKDPVDMIYILWSLYIGIVCGAMLFEVAVVTSLAVTVLLVILERISIGKSPYILVIHTNEEVDMAFLRVYSKRYRIKSRNYTSKGVDYTIEVSLKDTLGLMSELKKNNKIERYSLIEYDSDDVM